MTNYTLYLRLITIEFLLLSQGKRLKYLAFVTSAERNDPSCVPHAHVHKHTLTCHAVKARGKRAV